MAILKVRDEKLKTIMTPQQFSKFEATKPYAKQPNAVIAQDK